MTTIQAMRIIDLYADDILRSDGFNLEKRFMQHGKVSVFKHSLAVAVTCVRLASRFRLRVDMRSLVYAERSSTIIFCTTGTNRINRIASTASVTPAARSKTPSATSR